MIKQFIGVETASRPIDDIIFSDSPIIGTKGTFAEETTNSTPAALIYKMGPYPEDSLVRILIQPQGKRYIKDYVNNIWKLMAGTDALSLNRPKYLSDQLWNKVLLHNLYTTDNANLRPRQNIALFNFGSNRSQTMHMNFPFQARGQAEIIDNDLRPVVSLDFGSENISYVSKINTNKRNKHDLNLETVVLPPHGVLDWHKMGYYRYQTIIVRYIEWFVQLQRVMRLLMRDQLTWVNDPIVHKSNAISNEITEYESNNKFQLSDFE